MGAPRETLTQVGDEWNLADTTRKNESARLAEPNAVDLADTTRDTLQAHGDGAQGKKKRAVHLDLADATRALQAHGDVA
jgi:hypothetical protein